MSSYSTIRIVKEPGLGLGTGYYIRGQLSSNIKKALDSKVWTAVWTEIKVLLPMFSWGQMVPFCVNLDHVICI